MLAECLVVGGSGGIGSAIVRRFAKHGRDTVFTYLRAAESAQSLEHDCSAFPGSVRAVRLDVRNPVSVADVVSQCGPRLSAVIFCAASGVSRSVCDTRPRHFDFTFGINVRGFISVYQASFPALSANRGSIVTFSSLGSTMVMPGYGLIGASKAAMESLVRYMAAEGAASGLRVNTLSTSAVDTKALRSKVPGGDEGIAAVTRTPLGRSVDPEDIADAVEWLLSDAASMITGQVVTLDGGTGISAGLGLLAGALPA